MRTFLTVIMALACAFTFAQKKPNINKAKSAMDKGELAEAKTIIDQAIAHEKTKDDAKTWYYRGMIYAMLDTTMNEPKALETAVEAFNKSLKLDPEQKSTSSFTGTGLENVDTRVNNYYSYYYNQGIKYYTDQDFSEASMLFKKAYYIMPSDTNSIINAGFAAEAAEENEKAKEYYKQALASGVKDKAIYLRLYNFAVVNQELEEALEVINDAREVHPSDLNLQKYEINLLIQLERIDEAKSGIESAIAADPQNPDLYFSLGVIQEEIGEVEKAKETYKKAIEIDSEHYNSTFNLGVVIFNEVNEYIKERNALGYKEQKKYDELTKKINKQLTAALPYWEKLYMLNNTDTSVLETLKYIYANLKMNDKALKIADELDALGEG